jgi:hypothetical protein
VIYEVDLHFCPLSLFNSIAFSCERAQMPNEMKNKPTFMANLLSARASHSAAFRLQIALLFASQTIHAAGRFLSISPSGRKKNDDTNIFEQRRYRLYSQFSLILLWGAGCSWDQNDIKRRSAPTAKSNRKFFVPAFCCGMLQDT